MPFSLFSQHRKKSLSLPKARFVTSAAEESQCPKDTVPEIALAGRSNAGKSSFINCFSPGKPIAFVSQKPGKTSLLNIFTLGEHYRIVDMPGYGYASRPGDTVRTWQPMIENYLSQRTNLKGVLIFVDVRRELEKEEDMLVSWLESIGKRVAFVFTKIDKLNQKELSEFERKFKQTITIPYFGISSETKLGIADLESYIFSNWIQGD